MAVGTGIIVFVCFAGCAALVAAELRDWPLRRALFKTTASTAFVVLAVQVGATASSYGRFVLAALVLSWLGDVCLLSKQSRFFLLGLGSFLVAHIVFSIAFAQRPLSTSILVEGSVIMICGGLMVLLWLWRHLSGFYRAAVALYVAALVVMCSFALAMSAASGVWMVAGGALAFAASDISVARDRFIAPGFVNRAWGLPLYYAAQVILALSAGGA